MKVPRAIADFVPKDAEAGVGLALQDDGGRYLFFLAGTRHYCPPGELFYAGIGGHREANEETGTDVEILSAPTTWILNRMCSWLVSQSLASGESKA